MSHIIKVSYHASQGYSQRITCCIACTDFFTGDTVSTRCYCYLNLTNYKLVCSLLRENWAKCMVEAVL